MLLEPVRVAGNGVTPGTQVLESVPYGEGVRAVLGGKAIEAYSRETTPLIPLERGGSPHGFIAAAQAAYAGHYPLILSPDMIWLLIAQGFARHVNENAESLRSRFVAHAGQIDLIVSRADLMLGFAGNDWESIIAEFSGQIRGHIGADAHEMIAPTFSTTGIVEKAAFEVTLMDAMQSYFRYRVMVICGIPQFFLEGTPDDWRQVRTRAEKLAQYDLDWWITPLLPVLDEFVATSGGRANPDFWQRFYRRSDIGGCGYFTEDYDPDTLGDGGPITGHIVTFFPYLPRPSGEEHEAAAIRSQESYDKMQAEWDKEEATLQPEEIAAFRERSWEEMEAWEEEFDYAPTRNFIRNRLLTPSTEPPRRYDGIAADAFPTALSLAPFTLNTGNTEYKMEFVAGFVGASQDAETLALRPEIGWAVRYA